MIVRVKLCVNSHHVRSNSCIIFGECYGKAFDIMRQIVHVKTCNLVQVKNSFGTIGDQFNLTEAGKILDYTVLPTYSQSTRLQGIIPYK